MPRSPFTNPPAPNENFELSQEEYDAKYPERKRTLSGASTASLNASLGGSNTDSEEEAKIHNAKPGIYKPGKGSSLSTLIPQPNHKTLVNRQNKYNAITYAQYETPRLNELMERKVLPPTGQPIYLGSAPVLHRKPGPSKPPSIGTKRSRRGKKKRQTRRR